MSASHQRGYAHNSQTLLGAGGGWIYTAYFGLSLEPFSLTPDTAFFFKHPTCQDALNTLLFATRIGEGFIKVVGEVGTGKTLLCRQYLRALRDENYVTAYIPNPYVEPMTLLLAIADELGVAYPEQVSQHQLLKALTTFLIDTYARHRRAVIVCLDEAHALPPETLEALRLLSNLETSRRKLLQLVLFGQPELDNRLSHPSIRQLKQRISFSARLEPLTREEVQAYIRHRLRVAGNAEGNLFAAAAIRQLHTCARGTPRLINILAHKAMLAAFGEGQRTITRRHVQLAAADTESTRDSRGRWVRYLSAGVVSLLFTVGGLLRRYWE